MKLVIWAITLFGADVWDALPIPIDIQSESTMSVEEVCLQRFWHDYYDALGQFYKSLDKLDWVTYYKNHGTPMPANGCDGTAGASYQHVHYYPVVVTPQMQWLGPNAPPAGPGPCLDAGAMPMPGE